MPLYDAFISHSPANDKPIAASLQRALQTLGKPWYKWRALRVFRDDTSRSADVFQWPAIERALAQSRYLIVLASREAAVSLFAGKEVMYWLETRGVDRLLFAVTDRSLTWDDVRSITHLPALKARFAAEPKWVDLTAYRDGADTRDPRFTELAADFAAVIHGMPKEDLLRRELGELRRSLALASSAAVTLLMLVVLGGAALLLVHMAEIQTLFAGRG